MPAVDLVAHVKGLWGEHEENTALVLEYLAHQAGLDWHDRTVDPDDPEVRARREAAEAAGRKPPPRPLVTPMAHRPSWWQWRRLEEFATQVEPYVTPDEPQDELDDDAFLQDWLTHFA